MMLALIILRTARATEATSAGELQIQSDSGRTLFEGDSAPSSGRGFGREPRTSLLTQIFG